MGAADRLRLTAAQCPLEIVVTSQVRGGHAKGDAVPEDGGDEAVRAAVYLALGQGVELDGSPTGLFRLWLILPRTMWLTCRAGGGHLADRCMAVRHAADATDQFGKALPR